MDFTRRSKSLEVTPNDRSRGITRLEFLARVLDDAIQVPGTNFRFGLDPLLGLIPGLGDGIATFCSGLILIEAARLGAPKRYLTPIFGNILLDGLIGLVPLVGDIADFGFKSNRRNLEILRDIPEQAWINRRDAGSIRILLGSAVLLLLFGLAALGILLLRLLQKLIAG